MRGIVIDPGAKPELYRLPDTLQELQRFMGGYAQRCRSTTNLPRCFICRRPGKACRPGITMAAGFMGGSALLAGAAGRMTDLPMPLAEELLQKFTPVEVTP